MSLTCLLVTNFENNIETSMPMPSGAKLDPIDTHSQAYYSHPSVYLPTTGQTPHPSEQLVRLPMVGSMIELSDAQLDLGIDISFPMAPRDHITAIADLVCPLPTSTNLITYGFKQTWNPKELETIYMSAAGIPYTVTTMALPYMPIGAFIVTQNWEIIDQNERLRSVFLSYVNHLITRMQVGPLREFLSMQLVPSYGPSAVFVAAFHPRISAPDCGMIESA
jgi:hypothetical protein